MYMKIKLIEVTNNPNFTAIIKSISPAFNAKNIPAFKKILLTKISKNGKAVSQNQVVAFLKKEVHKFNQTHTLHKSQLNSFDWPASLGLTLNDAKELRLIKGVAMSSGTKKDNDIETQDNIAFATGTMSAFVQNSKVIIDIDHFKDGLPKDEYNEFKDIDIDKINAIYPPAEIIAVGLGRNKVGNNNEEKVQTEFLAVCENKYVYDLISKNKFIGCSTEENIRNRKCSEGNDCVLEGSHLPANTILLKGVPNSDSTWVSIVGKSDIGTILTSGENTTPNKLSKELKTKLLNTLKAKFLYHTNSDKVADITKYRNDQGNWINGLESINEFLKIEKNIDEDKSKAMADYLFANPTALNEVHLTFMSSDDLVSWFDNLNFNKIIKHQSEQLLKQQNAIKKLKTNAVQFGQGEVAYGDAEDGAKCFQCRWFTSFEAGPEEIPNSLGSCAIVAGDISGQKGCDQFAAIPSGSVISAEPTDNLSHSTPPNEDGTCNDGFTLGEVDGEPMCIKDEPTDNLSHSTPPNEDGTCNDGFTLGEVDGEPMCIKDEDVDLSEDEMNKLLNKKNSVKSTALRVTEPVQNHNKQIIAINKEIHELKNQLPGLVVVGLDAKALQNMGQRTIILNKIKKLEQKKRQLSLQ